MFGQKTWGREMYEVTIAYDNDASVFYVEKSDIIGLNAEATTQDELIEVIKDLAPELIAANHRRSSVWSIFRSSRAEQRPHVKVTRDLCLAL